MSSSERASIWKYAGLRREVPYVEEVTIQVRVRYQLVHLKRALRGRASDEFILQLLRCTWSNRADR